MLATKERWIETAHAQGQPERNIQQRPAPKKRPQPDRFGRLSMYVCVGAALAAMWCLGVNGARIYALNYHIATLKAQVANLSAVNASLTAQADTLAQPSRILDVALNRLHMHYATPVVIPASGQGGH